MTQVTVHAPAKLNLALEIKGIAENGYHEVDMLMQAVDVCELVKIEKSGNFKLLMPGSRVPSGASNTATRAAELFFTSTGLLAGARITISKVLPTRAGLAGGSADAAAVLVGLNHLYGAKLSVEELCVMGSEIGADVPFSIIGGTARATGYGEILEPIAPLENCYFTIAMPKGRGNSTPEVYKAYDEMYWGEKNTKPPFVDVEACVNAICTGNLDMLASLMGNVLEIPGSGRHTEKLKSILTDSGALAAMMTGSGAAVYGLFNSKSNAEDGADKIKGMCSHVFVARPVSHGARVVKEI